MVNSRRDRHKSVATRSVCDVTNVCNDMNRASPELRETAYNGSTLKNSHSDSEQVSTARRSITDVEAVFLTWGVVMAIVGYLLGMLQVSRTSPLIYEHPDGSGVCTACKYCATFAPRELCAVWRDQP